MCAFRSSDGREFTNRPMMVQHEARIKGGAGTPRAVKIPAGTEKTGLMEAEEPEEHDGEQMEVHSHGDGTFHTLHHDGSGDEPERTEHESLGDVHAHISSKMGSGEKHAHVSQAPGGEYEAHTVDEDGQHEAHSHENLEALKDHMGRFFDEEEQEGRPEQDQDDEDEGMGQIPGLG